MPQNVHPRKNFANDLDLYENTLFNFCKSQAPKSSQLMRISTFCFREHFTRQKKISEYVKTQKPNTKVKVRTYFKYLKVSIPTKILIVTLTF